MATENDNAASDDPFEKHINIAIEAQDGPSTETSNTGTESGEEAKGDEAISSPSLLRKVATAVQATLAHNSSLPKKQRKSRSILVVPKT